MTRFALGFADKEITVQCNGVNHHDFARPGMCLGCGAAVARREDGRVFDVVHYITDGGHERTAIRCYRKTHTCDPEREVAYMRHWNDALAAGTIMHDQHVVVTKGRKVVKGTRGVVFYRVMDHDFHGRDMVKIGIRDDAGNSYFLPESYVEADLHPASEPTTVDDCLDALAGVDMPTPGSTPVIARRAGSHAGCSHPATKSARAACRKARG